MRFRRSGGRGTDAEVERGQAGAGTPPGLVATRRRRRGMAVRRILALLFVALLVAAFLFVEQVWIRAEGLVRLIVPTEKADALKQVKWVAEIVVYI